MLVVLMKYHQYERSKPLHEAKITATDLVLDKRKEMVDINN